GAETTAGQGNGQGQDQDHDLDEPQQQGGRGGRGGPVAGRNEKLLTFEYELGTNKLSLLDEAPKRKPNWASVSPDGKTIVFARNHNLYMMDADNYTKALKDANDKSIAETELTKDGIEDFGYGGGRGMGGDQQQQDQNTTEGEQNGQNTRQR